MNEAYTYTKEEVLKKLGSTINGLNNEEVKIRQKEGKNKIITSKKVSLLEITLKQLKDKMVIILLIAAILSYILGEKLESIVILVIILINIIISVSEENKAITAVEALKKMNALYALVKRNNQKESVLAEDLVIGDIVYLEAGNIVPADIRLLKENNLSINESALTGESVTAEKNSNLVLPSKVTVAEQKNMAFSSTIVTYGTATGIVVNIGEKTEVGKIADMLENSNELDTPLKRKLNNVLVILSVVGIIISLLIFAIGLLNGRDLTNILMISLSLAISVIPEGLPATATVVMALGVQRMAKKNALIKELPAVETLGSVSTICTDKTGTLTQNKMTVINTWFYSNITKPPLDYYYCSILCNNADLEDGDPTEIALLDFVKKEYDVFKIKNDFPMIFEMPFDSKRKMMSSVHKINNEYICYTKGALEEILKKCTNIQNGDEIVSLTDKIREEILDKANKFLSEAHRILAFAKKTLKELPTSEDANLENDLTFIGISTMIDPPRMEAKKAVKACREAGIKVIMITGDHKLTGKAIGEKVGIFKEGDVIITGDDLNQMSDENLKKIIPKVSVFARVSPSDKMRIIKALKANGEVCAMTGDGVNDAPALKNADIGVAMGKGGTDVAKASADMILLDDNFRTIELAIREGRRIYDNIQKVIGYLLVGNIAEILVIFTSILFNYEAPLLAIHILFINLVTDTLPALALGVSEEGKNIMKRKPIKSGSLFDKQLILKVVLGGIYIALISLLAYNFGIRYSYDSALSMAFLVLCLSQIVHALNQASKNKYLYLAIFASMCLALAVYILPFTRELFSLTLLNIKEWLVVILLSLTPLLLKLFRKG